MDLMYQLCGEMDHCWFERERGIDTQRQSEMLTSTRRNYLYVSHNSATLTPRLNKTSNLVVNWKKKKGAFIWGQSVSVIIYLFLHRCLFSLFYENVQNIKGNEASHYIDGMSLCLSTARILSNWLAFMS